MIISVEKLREYITTDKTDTELEAMLDALELTIRKRTNNNFQKRAYRIKCSISDGKLQSTFLSLFKVGDTVQLSETALNEGIYTIASLDLESGCMGLNEALIDEQNVLVTKVEYPADVVMGAVEIIKWKLKNEAQNSGDTSAKEIQSETISRHSVTYVQDATESDIDETFGVPKKYTAFLKHYVKGRF